MVTSVLKKTRPEALTGRRISDSAALLGLDVVSGGHAHKHSGVCCWLWLPTTAPTTTTLVSHKNLKQKNNIRWWQAVALASSEQRTRGKPHYLQSFHLLSVPVSISTYKQSIEVGKYTFWNRNTGKKNPTEPHECTEYQLKCGPAGKKEEAPHCTALPGCWLIYVEMWERGIEEGERREGRDTQRLSKPRG